MIKLMQESDRILYNPVEKQAAFDASMDNMKRLDIVNKSEDCG